MKPFALWFVILTLAGCGGSSGSAPPAGGSGGLTVLYVSTEGSDQNAGSEAAPFKTLSAALAQATSGMTVQLLPGFYSEGELSPLVVPEGVTLRGASDGSPASASAYGIVVAGGSSQSPKMGTGAGAILLHAGASLVGAHVIHAPPQEFVSTIHAIGPGVSIEGCQISEELNEGKLSHVLVTASNVSVRNCDLVADHGIGVRFFRDASDAPPVGGVVEQCTFSTLDFAVSFDLDCQPDLGGGGQSVGGNRFDTTLAVLGTVDHQGDPPLFAENNLWRNVPVVVRYPKEAEPPPVYEIELQGTLAGSDFPVVHTDGATALTP